MGDIGFYLSITEGQYSEVIDRLDHAVPQDQSPDDGCIRALAYVLLKQPNDSRALLDQIDCENCDDRAKAICLEAEMLVEAYVGEDKDRVEFLARQALEFNQHSIFALRILGHIEESRKNFEGALDHYRSALDIYPESKRTSLDIARNLLFLKRRAEALRFIKGAPLSMKRIAYHISVALRGPFRIAVILAIAFLVVNPSTASHSFWAITALCVTGMISSWVISDNLIFSTAAYFQVSTIVFGILSFVLSRVMIE